MKPLLYLVAVVLSQVPMPSPTVPAGLTAVPPSPAGFVDWSKCGTYASGAAVRRGPAATVASASIGAACTGAWTEASANQLPVTEAGAWIGSSGNAIPYSNPDSHWGKDAGATVTPNSAACPIAPDGTQTMSLITAPANYNGTWPGVSGNSRSAWFALATGDSTCRVLNMAESWQDGQAISLTATPTRFWRRYTGTGAGGMFSARDPTNGCARWCMWRAQVNDSPVQDLATATNGSAVANGGSAVNIPFTEVSASEGVLGVCFTAAAGTPNARVLGTNVTTSFLYFGDVNQLFAYDGTNFVGPIVYTPGQRLCVIVSWSGSSLKIEKADGSAPATGSYDGSWGTTTITAGASYSGGSGWLNGHVEKICQDTSIALVRAKCR